MKSMAVIAIGSRIMKDDGIGVWVAEAIKKALNKAGIDVIIAETDFEYGFDAAKAYEYVVVLDAMVSGGTPGHIMVFPLCDAKAQERYASQHDMGLLEMMACEGGTCGSLMGIEAGDINFGFGLSKTLQQKFQAICDDAFQQIVKIKEDSPHA